ncbi:AGAP003872-PA [Anopheles gambiae str. PEST]|uniref:Pecanex-like protein n=1 Tax=Anopheles gambiae TaxID=7165 RepID=Q5TV94_ANOGA|nr:AGAP003872-PA [Anopheles gambiae str. PEST]
MGSQTLKILRQGVLASLTGGWYYDVHQNVFCNAVHLYIWLFLLFLPFIIYMYFPTTVAVWSVYCVLIAIIITFFKMVNVALHRMYDRARTLSETNLKKPGSASSKVPREAGAGIGIGGSGDDEPGIEMQILGTGEVAGSTPPANVSSRTSVEHHSDENSYANSAISIDYQEQVTSTIDLKVDVHRKNSSESSDSGLSGGGGGASGSGPTGAGTGGVASGATGGGLVGAVVPSAACSDACFRSDRIAEANNETPFGAPVVRYGGPVKTHTAEVCSTGTHKRSLSTPSQDRFSELVLETVMREMTREFGDLPLAANGATGAGGGGSGKSGEAVTGSRLLGAQSNASLRRHQYKSKRKQRFMNSQLQRQISLDSEKLNGSNVFADELAGCDQGKLGGEMPDGGARNRRRATGGAGGSSTDAGGVGPEGGLQLQRHLSSDDQNNKSVGSLFHHQLHHHHHHHHHHMLALQNLDPDLYMDHNYTKSAVQLAIADTGSGNDASGKITYLLHQTTPIRRDSSSTMSALQLPTIASSSSGPVGASSVGGGVSGDGVSTAGLGAGGDRAVSRGGNNASGKRRRHSNTAANTAGGNGAGRPLPRSLTSVRRIKSAALETCSPASIPNLTPTHPNSVEVIGGQTLRNPRHTVLPPPSKCLSRNPYLNLFTKSNEGSSGTGLVDVCGGGGVAGGSSSFAGAGCDSAAAFESVLPGATNAGSDPVYPIAEQSDESTPVKSAAGTGRVMARDESTPPVQRFDLHSDSEDGLEDDDEDEEDEGDGEEEEDDDDVDEEEENIEQEAPGREERSRQDGEELRGESYYAAEELKKPDRIGDSEEDLTLHDQLRRLHHQQQQQQQQLQPRMSEGVDDSLEDAAGVESDMEHPDSGPQSTDSDTETNAGSRSPLLEPRTHRTNSEQQVGAATIVEAKNAACCAIVPPKLIGSEVKKTSSSPTISCSDSSALHLHHHHMLRSPMKAFEETGCLSSSDWEQASASSKDLLIAKDGAVAKEGHGASGALKKAVATSESDPQIPGSSGAASKTKTNEEATAGCSAVTDTANGSTLSVAQLQQQQQPRNLGAIPKTSPPGRSASVRRLSVEENYPSTSSKIYNRSLSQRLLAERIPENSTAAPLITFLNYRSDVPIPPIYLPGNNALSEQQTASFTFRRPAPLPARPYRQLNCRLRMLKSDGGSEGGAGSSSLAQPGVSSSAGAAASSAGTAAAAGEYWRDDDNNNCNYCLDALESPQTRLQSLATAGAAAGGAGFAGYPAGARSICHDALMPGTVGEVPLNFYVTDDSDRWLRCAANVLKERFGAFNHHLHSHHHLHHHHHHHRTISISGPSTSGTSGVIGGLGSGGVGGSSGLASGGPTGGTISSAGDDFNTASINSGSGIADKTIVASTDCSLSRAQSTIDVVPHSMFGESGPKVRPKRYYKLSLRFLCFREHLNISMNRLQLLALFDRDTSWVQVVLAIALCTLVSLLGSLVLFQKFYEDLYAFIFCFVIAGSQYSLLKSVQPDAASPIHGFNKTVTYSRPIYFCLCCGLLLGIHQLLREYQLDMGRDTVSIVLFGSPISIVAFLQSAQTVLKYVILFFPLLFCLGLFPQINTFTMYFLEQVDMHLFGSNASCSLLASFLSVVRSIVACTLLFGLVYGALSETGTQHVLFSMYCAFLVTVSYHLSRCASDYTYIWAVIKSSLLTHSDYDDASSKEDSKISSDSGDDGKEDGQRHSSGDGGAGGSARSTDEMNRDFDEEAGRDAVAKELDDPLPRKLQDTVTARLKNDAVVCVVLSVAMFSLHCSTVFTVLQPEINHVLHSGACILGFLMHYIVPQLRKHLPWLCIAKPILKPEEFGLFEVHKLSKIMWFETMYVVLCFFERNILYPLIFISALTADCGQIADKFGLTFGSILIVMCSLKCVRNAYSDTGSQYVILIFTVLFFRSDYKMSSETFLLDYFLISILYRKIAEFLLKLQFVVTYIAPWQITWGSAFHAFAQPFSVPHSAMLFLQTAISAILSTPLNPFLGSAIFLTSYVRPIKFWERDYNTRRIDHSNTRLSSQLERDLGADDNNLNSIFYEHLTRSLQHSLCGDLLMGRWGNVSQGDCFVLASDYLNCLVHIIELGNGLCTFQMRGLEFRGTYCQQREVEAISEEVEDNIGCCCCTIGHLPRMLSANAMFTTRWLAWQVMASKYVLEGYSISDNSATATMQVFEFRKVLISYYVKSIIYYTLRSPKLMSWLQSQAIEEALEHTTDRQFVDLDPVFNINLDDDYDSRAAGITRSSFWCVYGDWIQFCSDKKRQQLQAALNERTPRKTTGAATATATTAAPSTATPGDSGAGNCFVSSSSNANVMKADSASGATKDGKGSTGCAAGTNTGSTVLDGWMEAGSADSKAECGESSGTNGNTVPAGTSSTGASAGSQANGAGSTNNASNGSANGTSFFKSNRDSLVTSLCMSLALLARRTLATASHSSSCGVEFFLHGLHALFKGDFRITCPRDEWVFADMELLHGVVAPAVRMSLKLHQDHFLCPDEYDDYSNLYNAIDFHTKELVISHEADPLWRNAVLRGTPNLLALRHVMDDGSDEYRVIRLTKRFLTFRVIKLNRECVRGLWAGQQQELIYLRNRNPERGSIQNAKQALRNIINSSCDQPIGYPIYVSPLTTSYAETNAQLCRIIGGEITLEKIQSMLIRTWKRIRQRCREGCSSGSAIIEGEMTEMQGVYCNTPTPNNTLSGTAGTLSYGSQNMSISGAAATRGSMASINKPTSSTLLAGFLIRERDAEREAMAMGTTGVRERSTIAKRNVGSTSKDRIDWAALQINKRDSFREVLAEAVAAAAGGASGSGNDSSVGADDESQSTAGGSPNSTLKQQGSVESTSGLASGYVHKANVPSSMLSGGGSGFSAALASGGNGVAAGSRIPGVPGTLTFTLSPPDDAPYSLFVMAEAQPDEPKTSVQWMHSPPTIGLNKKVIIVDASQIYDCLDLGRRIDVTWPNEQFRSSGGRSSWKEWSPQEGMVGNVVHYWQPNHPDHHYRSNVNRTILLVKIGERHVPIGEKGIKEYNTIGLVAAETLPTTVQGDESSRSGVAPGRQHSLEAVSEDTTSAIAVDSSTIVSSDRASTEANDMQSSPQSETQITSTTGNLASQGGTESEPKGVPDSMEEPAESSVDAAQTK